jgi:hypothetical protein
MEDITKILCLLEYSYFLHFESGESMVCFVIFNPKFFIEIIYFIFFLFIKASCKDRWSTKAEQII